MLAVLSADPWAVEKADRLVDHLVVRWDCSMAVPWEIEKVVWMVAN